MRRFRDAAWPRTRGRGVATGASETRNGRPARRPMRSIQASARTRPRASRLRPSPDPLRLPEVRTAERSGSSAAGAGHGLADDRPAPSRRPGDLVFKRPGCLFSVQRFAGGALAELFFEGRTKSATTPRGPRGRRRPGVRPCASRHGRAHRRRSASRAIRPRAGCRGPKSPKASYRPAVPRGYPAATGSMHRGSSFAGRLTKVLTGQAVMVSGGHGTSGTSEPASQGSNASGARITGIR